MPTPRTALVTGAAKRLGRAIALGLASDGWNIALHYGRSAADAQATEAAIRKYGVDCIRIQANLAEERSAEKVVEAVTRLGPISCLVNSASMFEKDTFRTMTFDSLFNHLRVNLMAPIFLARAVAARLPAKENGVIVNLLDQKIANPNTIFLSYTISKLALAGASDILLRELAPQWRVVSVAPGLVFRSGNQSEERFRALHPQTILNRGASPEDVVAAVRFLIDSPAIVGQTLFVDGGERFTPPSRRS